jgi:hypothetical protein
MRHVACLLALFGVLFTVGVAQADENADLADTDLAPIQTLDDLATRDSKNDLAYPDSENDLALTIVRD